jgi:hypothetical protein
MPSPVAGPTGLFPSTVPRSAAKRRAARRRRAVVRAVVFLLFFGGIAAGASMGIAAFLGRDDGVSRPVRCAAGLDGTDWYLETDQAETVALLAGLAQQRALPARALTIAIATGLQESKLRNIEHGDRDSLGIFQQRPSQGWGTEEEILDPVYATGRFYDALVEVPGYEEMEITAAAQAVQRSGFPDAYAQHEGTARAWASAMYGYTPGAVTCTLGDPGGAGDPQALADRALRDLGIQATIGDAGVVLDAAPLVGAPEDAERVGWAVAHWAVTVAEPLRIVSVEHAGSTWSRETGTWTATGGATASADPALTAGQVLVVLAD